MIRGMATVSLNGKMEESIKENGKMENNMALVTLSIKKEVRQEKVNGSKEREKSGLRVNQSLFKITDNFI